MCLTLTVRIKAQAGVENHKAAGVGADMNERIRELAEQVGATVHKAMHGKAISFLENDLERFADLVRQDEADGMRETYMKMIHGAIADEREACAKLCEKVHADYINDRNNDGYDWPDGYNCAEAIRAISNNRIKTSKDICGND
jgi:hypothetical protein